MTLEFAIIIHVFDEPFEMWLPELIMLAILRIFPAPIRVQLTGWNFALHQLIHEVPAARSSRALFLRGDIFVPFSQHRGRRCHSASFSLTPSRGRHGIVIVSAPLIFKNHSHGQPFANAKKVAPFT